MSILVKKRLGTLVFPAILAALVLAAPLTGFATDINNQGQTFNSVADVARAEQLASKTAGQPTPEVIAAIQAEQQAEVALQAAIQSGDSQAIAAAQAAMMAAEMSAETVMAQACAVTTDDVGAMRGSGMGWAQIAHELGVQPGSLGLDHAKGSISQHTSEMVQATSRGIRGGQSMMHGVHSGNFTGSRGMGLDHAAQNYGGWANFSGARGGDHAGGSGSGHGMGGSMGGAGYDANHGRGMDSGMSGGWGANHGGEMSAGSDSSGGHGSGMGNGPSGGHGGGSGGGPGGGSGGGSGGGGGGCR
mgnify:CR=1 FL=1